MIMNTLCKILWLATAIVLALGVAFLCNKDEAHPDLAYVGALLAQQGCTVREANKTDDATYLCNEGLDNYVAITIEFVLAKDLGADGTEEILVVWTEQFGGSGFFKYLGVFSDDAMRGKTGIGDRVVINGIDVEDGLISVEVIAHGEDDPACCPRVNMTKRFAWDGHTLRPASEIFE